MSIERVMFLSIIVVGLLLLGMVGVVVLLRNFDKFKPSKTDSSADKSKEQKK